MHDMSLHIIIVHIGITGDWNPVLFVRASLPRLPAASTMKSHRAIVKKAEYHHQPVACRKASN